MQSADSQGLTEAFWSVARAIRHSSSVALTRWDITPGQARALGVVERDGPLRLSALSEELRIAPRSVTEVIDALEHRGWVRRQADPTDRRATLVALTRSGTGVSRSIRDARVAASDELFERLSARDRADLARVLGKLGDGRD